MYNIKVCLQQYGRPDIIAIYQHRVNGHTNKSTPRCHACGNDKFILMIHHHSIFRYSLECTCNSCYTIVNAELHTGSVKEVQKLLKNIGSVYTYTLSPEEFYRISKNVVDARL